MITLSPQGLQIATLAVSTVIPLLIAAVLHWTAPSWLKAALNLILTFLLAFGGELVTRRGIWDIHLLENWVLGYVVSGSTHAHLWKPLGVTNALGEGGFANQDKKRAKAWVAQGGLTRSTATDEAPRDYTPRFNPADILPNDRYQKMIADELVGQDTRYATPPPAPIVITRTSPVALNKQPIPITEPSATLQVITPLGTVLEYKVARVVSPAPRITEWGTPVPDIAGRDIVTHPVTHPVGSADIERARRLLDQQKGKS